MPRQACTEFQDKQLVYLHCRLSQSRQNQRQPQSPRPEDAGTYSNSDVEIDSPFASNSLPREVTPSFLSISACLYRTPTYAISQIPQHCHCLPIPVNGSSLCLASLLSKCGWRRLQGQPHVFRRINKYAGTSDIIYEDMNNPFDKFRGPPRARRHALSFPAAVARFIYHIA